MSKNILILGLLFSFICLIIPTKVLRLAMRDIGWQPGSWAMGCDFRGNDLVSKVVPGELCGGTCAATSGCTHFTWTSFNGGTCWMKQGNVQESDAIEVSDRSFVCGIVNGGGGGISWQIGDWAMGCDFQGDDLVSRQMPGEQCGGACASTSGCTHFTWTSFNRGTCWMKQGPVQKSDAVVTSDKTFVCGIINGGGSVVGLITNAQFVAAVTKNGYPSPTDEQYRNIISRAGPAGKITDKRELAMFLANVLLESDGLRAKSEYNPPPGSYQYPPYDVPGQRYYGRGYMMLSWSYNYRAASFALYNDDRLLKNPSQVATDDAVAWDTAFWFWSANVHGKPGISDGRFGASTLAINGGIECGPGATNTISPRRRFEIYRIVFAEFGVSGTPDERGCYN